VKKINDIWLKAAVLGGLWATIEIILGSFFHNLRLPFSGTMLAIIGIVLMISFYQKWPEKGLVWRAGLICALMKSISPSAVILGPMLGIMTEALILSFFIYIFGNRLLSFVVAAPLAVFSALIHKIISVIILYGYNIVKLYKNIYYFAVKQLHWQHEDPMIVIYVLMGMYLILGLFAALFGWYIGRLSTEKPISVEKELHNIRLRSNPFAVKSNFKHSVLLLFIHILIIPVALFFLNFFDHYPVYLIVSGYLGFSFWRYGKFLRRFQKLTFWWQLFILTILAGIFITGLQKEGNFFTWEGIWIGLGMNFRAIFVVVAFSSLGVELKNKKIKDFLFRKGFQVIYQVLELSFAALPMIIQSMPPAKKFIRRPVRSLSGLLASADEWLEIFEEENKK
jgi:MFS family permease